ncbi:uncharacterized protein METZ01_LOCUS354940 [marine metagenome]|uniref:Uncharacterized protein n=1 Tax=marine metagenome TaxID=408172 RepID=A0A382RWP7_9ZZZZ
MGVIPAIKTNSKKAGLGNCGEFTRKLYRICWSGHLDLERGVFVEKFLN